MNKRGQFYLIISIIIAIAAFAVTATPNEIKEAILFEEFEDLTNNYVTESEYAVNNALSREGNVEVVLDDFTKNYIKYAKQRSPDLQLLYVYSDGDQIKLYNYFDDVAAPAEHTDSPLPLGAQQELIQDIKVIVGGKEFSHKVPIQTENFGHGWYSASVPNSFNLSVGGFFHTFNLDPGNPDLQVLINLPSGPEVFQYGDVGTEYEFQFSPEQNGSIVTNQVKKR
jgi:hypothetical protein